MLGSDNASNGPGTLQNGADFQSKKPLSSPGQIGRLLIEKKIITEHDLKAALERKQLEPAKYLGQILCDMGIPQHKIMKVIYEGNKRKKFGEVLVDLKIITAEQLGSALMEQKHLRNIGIFMPIGTLLAKNGTISEDNYIRALSAHFSMPVVSLKGYIVLPALQKAIGEQYAWRHHIVVLSNSPQKVAVALAEPHLSIFENLEKAMPKDRHVMFCLAKASEIENCLARKYDPFS